MKVRKDPPLASRRWPGLILALCMATMGLGCDPSRWLAYPSQDGCHANRRGCVLSVPSVVSTFSGSGKQGYRDGPADQAEFWGPDDLAMGPDGSLYVADQNPVIRRIDRAGSVQTIAANVPGEKGPLKGPSALAVEASGSLLVADLIANRIFRVDPASGSIIPIAGTGVEGTADGPAMEAQFHGLHGLAIGSDGTVYIADGGAHRIRVLSPAGVVSTLAGSVEGFADGQGAEAKFRFPMAVAVAKDGRVFVADFEDNRIRQIDRSGKVTTLAGDGTTGDDDGNGGVARFIWPGALSLDGGGNLAITGATDRIRIMMSDGVVRTLTGGAATVTGYRDGPGDQALFAGPHGVATDGGGTVYVADSNNNRIRKVVWHMP